MGDTPVSFKIRKSKSQSEISPPKARSRLLDDFIIEGVDKINEATSPSNVVGRSMRSIQRQDTMANGYLHFHPLRIPLMPNILRQRKKTIEESLRFRVDQKINEGKKAVSTEAIPAIRLPKIDLAMKYIQMLISIPKKQLIILIDKGL